MERSSENQGELSLIEMIENFNKPDGKRTTESSSSASIAIALNEEMNRRQVFFSFFLLIIIISYLPLSQIVIQIQECEKVMQQLYTEISELKQENAVAKAGIQRKDSLLVQAQQQWKTLKVDWEQRLELAKDEKNRLDTVSWRNDDLSKCSAFFRKKKPKKNLCIFFSP
jgi:hypothetical protein